MSASVLDEERLDRLAVYSLVGIDRHQSTQSADGTWHVENVESFKAGTFKDSLGEQRTWTPEQLAQMVNNFELLRQADIFPHVPLRVDHSWSADKIAGYITGMRVSGDRLLLDLNFTEPAAYEKYARGTYRSRSLEVGMYEDNNGVTYYPVVFGLAFVDIPAVEGLHRGPHKVGCFSYLGEQEPSVPDKDPQPVPDKPFVFSLGHGGEQAREETDYAKVQAYVSALEGENASLKTRNDALETFAKEQTTKARHEFVGSLCSAKKIAAPQVDSMKALVETMTDEQYEAFRGAYEKAPQLSLLGEHGSGVTNPTGEPDPLAEELATLEEIVAMHRRSGMKDDELAKTTSYRRMTELTAAAK